MGIAAGVLLGNVVHDVVVHASRLVMRPGLVTPLTNTFVRGFLVTGVTPVPVILVLAAVDVLVLVLGLGLGLVPVLLITVDT